MANLIITIDGPAASGKSTVAQLLAERLGASFLDTGAMYRAVTLAAMQDNIDMGDEKKLVGVLDSSKFKFVIKKGKTVVFIDDINVTEQIRRPEVTADARHIASAAKVRAKLVQMQREFAAGEEKIVTEGRDQGTVAFPDADIKFYLTAKPAERARRRQAELRAKGGGGNLKQIALSKESIALPQVALPQVQKAIEERDKSDESRAVGPLKPAADAVVIDTTDLNVEEVVEKLLRCVKEKCLKKD